MGDVENMHKIESIHAGEKHRMNPTTPERVMTYRSLGVIFDGMGLG